MTDDTVAKPLVKDRFWILSKNGESVGLLNKLNNSHYIVTQNGKKIAFNSKEKLLDKYPLRFIKYKTSNKKNDPIQEIYGYPINSKTGYNITYDLKRKLPLYNKQDNSKCWFCAGHYIIYFYKIGWTTSFCPKLITLDRYKYQGPFKTAEEAKEALRHAKSST